MKRGRDLARLIWLTLAFALYIILFATLSIALALHGVWW